MRKTNKKLRIGIVLLVNDLSPAYSPVEVTKGQIHMLKRYGHDITLLLEKNCRTRYLNTKGINLLKCLPQIKPQRKKSKRLVKQIRKSFEKSIKNLDVIITHDLINLTENLPYRLAIKEAATKSPKTTWLHWIHSNVYKRKPFFKNSPKGKIIVPFHGKRKTLASAFQTNSSNINTVYHVVDPQAENSFHHLTKKIIDDYNLLNRDIVQLYPASMFNIIQKNTHLLIKMFAIMKILGKKVTLIIANSYFRTKQDQETVNKLKNFAHALGLSKEEVVFSSDIDLGNQEKGLPHQVIMELFGFVTNIFILPSHSETFSLITMEAALGKNLLVLNKSLTCLKNIFSHNHAIFQHFGAYPSSLSKNIRLRHKIPKRKENLKLIKLAKKIIRLLSKQKPLLANKRLKEQLNMDWIYKNQLEPLLYS